MSLFNLVLLESHSSLSSVSWWLMIAVILSVRHFILKCNYSTLIVNTIWLQKYSSSLKAFRSSPETPISIFVLVATSATTCTKVLPRNVFLKATSDISNIFLDNLYWKLDIWFCYLRRPKKWVRFEWRLLRVIRVIGKWGKTSINHSSFSSI